MKKVLMWGKVCLNGSVKTSWKKKKKMKDRNSNRSMRNDNWWIPKLKRGIKAYSKGIEKVILILVKRRIVLGEEKGHRK
jgi:hypothetical protein